MSFTYLTYGQIVCNQILYGDRAVVVVVFCLSSLYSQQLHATCDHSEIEREKERQKDEQKRGITHCWIVLVLLLLLLLLLLPSFLRIRRAQRTPVILNISMSARDLTFSTSLIGRWQTAAEREKPVAPPWRTTTMPNSYSTLHQSEIQLTNNSWPLEG